MTKICITFYHTWYHIFSLLNTPYHTLSPTLEQNYLVLATLKLVPKPQSFYHILSRFLTPYHTLSHLIPKVGKKPFSIGNFRISSQAPNFLSQLIMPSHSWSHLITPYPLGWKQNHLMLATFKLVPRLQSFCHILSRFLTLYHTLSHLIPLVGEKTLFNWQL